QTHAGPGAGMTFVVRRCCDRYNAARQERKHAWPKRGVSVTCASQSAQWPAIQAVRPDSRDSHAQVVRDALTRLERAFQAYIRRVRDGPTPGSPCVHGRARSTSFTGVTSKQVGDGATLDNWTTACWSGRRADASPCAGPGPSTARARRSRSLEKPTAGPRTLPL